MAQKASSSILGSNPFLGNSFYWSKWNLLLYQNWNQLPILPGSISRGTVINQNLLKKTFRVLKTTWNSVFHGEAVTKPKVRLFQTHLLHKWPSKSTKVNKCHEFIHIFSNFPNDPIITWLNNNINLRCSKMKTRWVSISQQKSHPSRFPIWKTVKSGKETSMILLSSKMVLQKTIFSIETWSKVEIVAKSSEIESSVTRKTVKFSKTIICILIIVLQCFLPLKRFRRNL